MKGQGIASSAKRIQKELADISLDPPSNCSAGPKGDNIYEWASTILGPGGENYEIYASPQICASSQSQDQFWCKKLCGLLFLR